MNSSCGGPYQEGLYVSPVAQDCMAKFLDNMLRMTQAACYAPTTTRNQGLMDRLSQSVDVLGQAMVGRCRSTVSNPELKARLVPALETKM